VLLETFKADEVQVILAAGTDAEWKGRLTANTEKVLKLGAFGAPWFWVKNGKGVEEPFFGSDRYIVDPNSSSVRLMDGLDSTTCGSFWACHGRISESSLWRKSKRNCKLKILQTKGGE
jgi:hypothetical protein